MNPLELEAMFIVFVTISNIGNKAGATLRRLSIAALSALLLCAVPAHAADDATADSVAVVLNDSQLKNVEPLQFGRIVPTGLGGSVMINVNTGTVSTIGQVSTVGSDQTRARFTVKAPIGIVMIVIGDPTVELTRVGGTETMTASLVHRGTTGLATVTVLGLPIGLIATAPDQEIYTGGSLVVAGNQAPGTYEGSFTLMVAYL